MPPLNFKTKIVASVCAMIFGVMLIGTLIYIHYLRTGYFEALQWRSEALAQSLVITINRKFKSLPKMQAFLNAEISLCTQLYHANKDKNLTHISVIDASNVIVAHNDPQMIESPIESAVLLEQLEKRENATVLDGDSYHTLVPISGLHEKSYIGTVDIGFAKQTIDAATHTIFLYAMGILGIALFLSFLGVSYLLQRFVGTPISDMAEIGRKIAVGQPVEISPSDQQNDEIAILRSALYDISTYVKHITNVTSHITEGTLDDKVHIRSQGDMLGRSVRQMQQYLQEFSALIGNISEGDLSQTIELRSSNDTFGRVMLSMNEGLRTLIAKIRVSADQIASMGQNITALTSRDLEIVNHIDDSIAQVSSTMDELGGSVGEVAKNLEALSASSEETSSAVIEMAASIEQIATESLELSERADESIGFLKEAVDTLGGIVNHTEDSKALSQETIDDATAGQKAVEDVMLNMITIHHTVTTSVESLARFAKRSEDIGSVLEVIRNISEQTSLLALNASIIAAQAGSHGRGFAVVADEIKSLADGVGTSAKDIAEIVKSLQQETKQVVQGIHEGAGYVKQGIGQTRLAMTTLEKIIGSAERSSSVVSEIAETLHALLQDSRNVANSMERVNEMTDGIKQATGEQQLSSAQINHAIEHINQMSSQIHRATAEQLQAIHQVLEMAQAVSVWMEKNRESSQQIAESMKELASHSDVLVTSIDRFTLERDEKGFTAMT